MADQFAQMITTIEFPIGEIKYKNADKIEQADHVIDGGIKDLIGI